MKLALHRSIVFWSGLLVMAFVCWAWWGSHHHSSYASKGSIKVSNGMAGLFIERHDGYGGPGTDAGTERIDPSFREVFRWFPAPHWVRKAHLTREWRWMETGDCLAYESDMASASTLRDKIEVSFGFRDAGDWNLFVPHWLILLAVAAPWLSLLLWRAHRRKRITTP